VNLAKGVELALHDGRDPLSGKQIGPHTGDSRAFTTFEQLWQAYTRQMDFFLERAHACIRAAEGQWPQINPSPLLAGSLDDCLRSGKDIGQGGAHYNSVGFVGAALANASDALLALKQVVYDDERFTLDEVISAMTANFEGHERMRQYLINRVPKWGNHHPDADWWAKRVADYYCHKVHTFTNGRGGPCQAALFSLDFAW
jgi:pyruvate-formate lyase